MPFAFDLDAYLERIGLTSAPAADAAGLQVLHAAQFEAIPFENFDVQLGRGVDLSPEHVFRKLVFGSRGGYCFELNGLMLMALQALGFTARPLLARVHLLPEPSGRTHQLSLVELATGPWVCDVGFGAGGPRCPLPLADGAEMTGDGWAFRLQKRDPWGLMLQSREKGEWRDSYSFDLEHVAPADIALGNHYTSTAPTSHFVTERIASRPLATGRVSLRDFTLTRLDAAGATVSEVPAGEPYLQTLADVFGIVLDGEYRDLKPLPHQKGTG